VILHVFLLAQDGKPLLFPIHGEDHKQTQNQQKEESNHAHRIAHSLESVLYREFASTKQLCKPIPGVCLRRNLHLQAVNLIFLPR